MQSPIIVAIHGLYVIVFLLFVSTMLTAQVKIHERVEINKTTSTFRNTNQLISNTDPNWTEQYDGKILFKVPGTLRLKLRGFCIGSYFMAGWCWESIYGCCCCSQPSPGFGPTITVEKGGSIIFQYNPKDYWIESRPRVECTNEWWDTVSVTYWMPVGEDPFNSTGSIDLGPFQVGDEVTITVAASECTSLSYRARNKEVNCENSNYDLAYRLDHPYTEASCPGVSNSCDEGVDLPWLSVEIPDMPQYDQNCFVMSVSSNKIHPGEKVGITIEQVDCLGNLVPFPADQIFSMWMNIDAKYGKLSCSGSEGSYVFGQQPFEFIAADIIDVDSIVVDIGASLGGGMASSIQPGNDTLRLSGPLMSSKQVTEVKKDAVSKEMNSLQSQLNKETVKKGDENQQDKLSRRLEQFIARFAHKPAKTPAEKQNALTSVKQIAKTSSMQVECNPTVEVTIKNDCLEVIFPPCKEGQTSFEGIKARNVKYTWGDGGCTVPFPIGGDYDSFIHPQICYNESDNCYGLMIPEVSADLQIGVGDPCCSETREVNSSNDIPDIETARKVIEDLTNLKKDIDRVITNYRYYESPLRTYSLIRIDQSKVHSSTGILRHEQTHAGWWFSVFKQALENVNKQRPQCKSKNDFQDQCQVKDYFASSINDIQGKFDKNVKDIANEQLNNTEIEAHEQQQKFIDNLIEDIRNKFHLQNN